MEYIVFDLEFNQDIESFRDTEHKITKYPYEIIQIGAVKLDANMNTISTFNRYIKPVIYSRISTFVTELTGITTDQLVTERPFHEVLDDFIEFIGERSNVFCVWGMSDMKELFRNVEYHQLDKKNIPVMYLNLQPYVSKHLRLSPTLLLNLKAAVEALHIIMPYKFHNAFHDAYYTSEIFTAIHSTAMQPKHYDPNYIIIRPRQQKKIIDFEKLLQQFEKMYSRELSNDEQNMIKLAYQMGKTNQFIK